MADRKGPKEVPPQGRQSGKQMSEKSPNPHGESKILEMPIRTQKRNETTGKNIPQVPNTIGGNLNPSVAHDFENRGVSSKNAADKPARTGKTVKEFKRKDA
ncbi:MAG TPA: hypothetical protein VN223_02780 [Candidatus Elarobacter sp.]|jgi:hypothetical protein|nr:hypothetical protein [Candidatus Elarobacter sp.]